MSGLQHAPSPKRKEPDETKTQSSLARSPRPDKRARHTGPPGESSARGKAPPVDVLDTVLDYSLASVLMPPNRDLCKIVMHTKTVKDLVTHKQTTTRMSPYQPRLGVGPAYDLCTIAKNWGTDRAFHVTGIHQRSWFQDNFLVDGKAVSVDDLHAMCEADDTPSAPACQLRDPSRVSIPPLSDVKRIVDPMVTTLWTDTVELYLQPRRVFFCKQGTSIPKDNRPHAPGCIGTIVVLQSGPVRTHVQRRGPYYTMDDVVHGGRGVAALAMLPSVSLPATPVHHTIEWAVVFDVFYESGEGRTRYAGGSSGKTFAKGCDQASPAFPAFFARAAQQFKLEVAALSVRYALHYATKPTLAILPCMGTYRKQDLKDIVLSNRVVSQGSAGLQDADKVMWNALVECGRLQMEVVPILVVSWVSASFPSNSKESEFVAKVILRDGGPFLGTTRPTMLAEAFGAMHDDKPWTKRQPDIVFPAFGDVEQWHRLGYFIGGTDSYCFNDELGIDPRPGHLRCKAFVALAICVKCPSRSP